MRVFLIVLMVAAAQLAVGCSNFEQARVLRAQQTYLVGFDSKDRGMNSRYLREPPAGKMYQYGNFCGPGVPFAERDPANLAKAAAVKPVDTLDRTCKLHDMCYMRWGADNVICDYLAISNLGAYYYNLGMPLQVQCAKLHDEIRSAMFVKKNTLAGYMASPITAAFLPVGSLVQWLEAPAPNLGFPIAPGHCVSDFGLANQYIGLEAFTTPPASPDLDMLHETQQRAESNNLRTLHREMAIIMQMEVSKGCPGCTPGMFENFLYMPAADVEYFLSTGMVREMPDEKLAQVLQMDPRVGPLMSKLVADHVWYVPSPRPVEPAPQAPAQPGIAPYPGMPPTTSGEQRTCRQGRVGTAVYCSQ